MSDQKNKQEMASIFFTFKSKSFDWIAINIYSYRICGKFSLEICWERNVMKLILNKIFLHLCHTPKHNPNREPGIGKYTKYIQANKHSHSIQ